ncbi:EamA family transporter [Leptolyngbya sp. FACHB-261]|uniref:EamA family transporter n=1 Tax=Leptolyngbya sp. FACHB-261 TaxID=2692806 RepID=UPI00168A02D6|nr:EamA family transporter [Leptolyngbya sp. FACHB-261]MBD2104273.1 EamA family transporter [Leptolyngbya sp. FACHB-261]
MAELENQRPTDEQGTQSQRVDSAGASPPRAGSAHREGQLNGSTEKALGSLASDLQALKQSLVTPLLADVERLQTEKTQLLTTIERLKAEQATLQGRSAQLLSQAQTAQQQQWARQLAQLLAARLHESLKQQLTQMAGTLTPSSERAGLAVNTEGLHAQYSRRTDELLLSMDASLKATFATLQQDLNSYESSLSQQLSRMHVQEQQAEVILAALVSRLREQFRQESSTARRPGPSSAPEEVRPEAANEGPSSVNSINSTETLPSRSEPVSEARAVSRNSAPEETMQRPQEPTVPVAVHESNPAMVHMPKPPAPPRERKRSSNGLAGLVLVLFSSLLLALQNVLVQFGLTAQGSGALEQTFSNSLQILFLRVLFVVPLLWLIAGRLRPRWPEVGQLFAPVNRGLGWRVVGSGVFLFVSQLCLYLAIGTLQAGPATTVFFIYPTVTALLAWLVFRDRINWLRLLAIPVVYVGVFLTLGYAGGQLVDPLGSTAAIVSGVTFAISLILSDTCFPKIHPVSLMVLNFSIVLLLSCIGLPLMDWSNWALLPLCLALALMTLGSYLAYYVGIRMVGAAPASLVASLGPAFTVLLAWGILRETLPQAQAAGLVLVTLGVATLFARERLRRPIEPRTRYSEPRSLPRS